MIQYFRWTQNLNMCYVAHIQREVYMKYIKILLFALFLSPIASHAASNEFVVAAQLLSAAKNADFQQVQALVNSGADINFVDSTGLSIVCTALMNNDIRAAQILQMYGADASQCDRQIKQYNSRTKPKINSGGLFGGLSTAQGMALAAAGAAVVIGGLYWLTDVFDPDNGNSSSSGNNGNRPNNNPDDPTNGGDNAKVAFSVPYGPAMVNDAKEQELYADNLNAFGQISYLDTFNQMNKSVYQNYLLLMHGYSPMARGYLGMRTLRNLVSREPLNLSGNSLGDNTSIQGGMPINVAIVTTNGINAADETSLENKFMLWGTTNNNNTTVNGAVNKNLSSKYYNNKITLGANSETILDDSVEEDSVLYGIVFDLSGNGTAIHNTSATDLDNMLAKVIVGSGPGEYLTDYMGFMPNGQLTVFRTGGDGFVPVSNSNRNGTYTIADNTLATGDKISLFGIEFDVTRNGDRIIITSSDGETVYNGEIDANGMLILNDVETGGYTVKQMYKFDLNNKLVLVKQTGVYTNYQALYNAISLLGYDDNYNDSGRSRPSVIVNTAVLTSLHDRNAAMIEDVFTTSDPEVNFYNLINNYYDPTGSGKQVKYASDFYTNTIWNGSSAPLLIYSTGGAKTDMSNQEPTSPALYATFENAAPLLYSNLQHKFMSVVGVSLSGGTSEYVDKKISDFLLGQNQRYMLSNWKIDNNYYRARMCGIAGTGTNTLDPWCFASVGATDELATASAAGAVGVLKSAFDYLDNKQIFTLLALTADGPFLGYDYAGNKYTTDNLVTYLKNMYQLPSEIQYKVDVGNKSYLDAFADVFGYGLINLERATTPGKSIYYYDGQTNKIVSASGNAYWRNAQNTTVRSSIAFNPRTTTISAPFFDILTSVDGNLSLPRVWKNEFSLGTTGRRGLYMGDVLGDLHISDNMPIQTQIGDIALAMSTSHREYTDNFGGLDNLQLGFSSQNWDLTAGYQHYFTDNTSRFDGAANPILSLASNAVTSGAQYHSGNWTFGLRAFSGTITDEGLLETDPTISAQYKQAHLGLMHGAQSGFGYKNDKFGFDLSFGSAKETETFLGAQTNGLLDLGAGHTMYVDNTLRYAPTKDISFGLHSTFARTTSDATGEFILGMSNVYSDAYAFTTNVGNFSFSLSQPLAITHGVLHYSHADYDIITDENGHYNLNIINTGAMGVDLRPAVRELRINASYKHKFGEFTDGAFGFIYRVNPNNTDAYGNESILMMKMHHRIGI